MTILAEEGRELITDRDLLKRILLSLGRDAQGIRKALENQALDIDEWKYEQSATTFQPLRDYDGPVVITSILAVFPTASTSVVINMGAPGRTIPITAISAGIFAVNDLRMQMAQDDAIRNMVIAPAGTGYINFFGYADKKVIDHA